MPLGIGTAAGIAQGVAGALGIGTGDRRQLKQQEKLQAMQIEGNKEMLEAQRQKEMQMWHDTNYGAQVEELKNAGMNPALLYGKGGGGGTTIGGSGMGISAGASATGAQRSQAASQAMGIGLQGAMMEAQIEVMKSQANLNNTEAEKKGGVDTKEAEARIQDITQGIENKKAQQELTQVQTTLNQMDAEIKGKTIEQQIDQIGWLTQKAEQEFKEVTIRNYINSETRNDKIAQIQAEAIGALLRNLNTQADTTLKGTQNTATITGLQQKWKELSLQSRNLDQNDKRINIEKFAKEMEANYPSIMESSGKLMDDITNWLWDMVGKERPRYNKVK